LALKLKALGEKMKERFVYMCIFLKAFLQQTANETLLLFELKIAIKKSTKFHIDI